MFDGSAGAGVGAGARQDAVGQHRHREGSHVVGGDEVPAGQGGGGPADPQQLQGRPGGRGALFFV